MYNRYIPQNDGTYRRSRVGDPTPPQRPAPPPEVHREEPQEESCPCPEGAPPCQQGQPCGHMRQPQRPIPPRPKSSGTSVGSFLKRLIPSGFDTEDLIIVLLLLLMAGDCQEDQNSALLTLVLYLFL